jgi:hypothetical protein
VVAILMKASLSGPGRCWIGGRTYETDADEAASLVAGGIAEYAHEPHHDPELEPKPIPEPGFTDQMAYTQATLDSPLRDVVELGSRPFELLAAEGVETVAQYLALEDPTAIKGIGPATDATIREQIEQKIKGE